MAFASMYYGEGYQNFSATFLTIPLFCNESRPVLFLSIKSFSARRSANASFPQLGFVSAVMVEMLQRAGNFIHSASISACVFLEGASHHCFQYILGCRFSVMFLDVVYCSSGACQPSWPRCWRQVRSSKRPRRTRSSSLTSWAGGPPRTTGLVSFGDLFPVVCFFSSRHLSTHLNWSDC
jgi:hypothetical protein